jgi:hypothetical protein
VVSGVASPPYRRQNAGGFFFGGVNATLLADCYAFFLAPALTFVLTFMGFLLPFRWFTLVW